MRKASHRGSKFTCHDHSIIACSRHIYVWCCSSRTSRSWWITQSTQHYRRGCNNIPSFLQRTAPIARFLCEGWTPHDLHILDTAPFCCDRKSRAAYAQSFAPWQPAIIGFTCHDHSIIACSRHIYVWCCSSRTSRSWWITKSTQHHRRGCNTTKINANSASISVNQLDVELYCLFEKTFILFVAAGVLDVSQLVKMLLFVSLCCDIFSLSLEIVCFLCSYFSVSTSHP